MKSQRFTVLLILFLTQMAVVIYDICYKNANAKNHSFQEI